MPCEGDVKLSSRRVRCTAGLNGEESSRSFAGLSGEVAAGFAGAIPDRESMDPPPIDLTGVDFEFEGEFKGGPEDAPSISARVFSGETATEEASSSIVGRPFSGAALAV